MQAHWEPAYEHMVPAPAHISPSIGAAPGHPVDPPVPVVDPDPVLAAVVAPVLAAVVMPPEPAAVMPPEPAVVLAAVPPFPLLAALAEEPPEPPQPAATSPMPAIPAHTSNARKPPFTWMLMSGEPTTTVL